jgi:hypothetical protein
MKLTIQNVGLLASECRAPQDMPESQVIEVVGARYRGRFNPVKLREHQATIAEVVGQLPRQFHQDGGGGYSMLMACMRQDGEQWCDTQTAPDILACLAIAAGTAQWALPRELFEWSRLPGGMPYLVVGPCVAPLPGAHLRPTTPLTLEQWLKK